MNIIQIRQRIFTISKVFFAVTFLFATVFSETKRKKAASPTDFTYRKPFAIDTNKFPLGSFNSVNIVRDKNKHIFIIKNFNNPEQAIHEALGAHIGALAGIRINKVKIIPPHMHFVGKCDDCVATIHTLVPGQEVEKSTIGDNIHIIGGLTCCEHLQSLVLYDDLCSIVALDIFLDNFDRHNGNLFFDKKSGYFYAIDMDRVFNLAFSFSGGNPNLLYEIDIATYSSLAVNAYDFLITLSDATLSPQEIRALNHLRDWLSKLLNQYSSMELYNLWMDFAHKAQYTYVPLHKVCIQTLIDCNYTQVQRVVTQINTLVIA